MLAMKTVTGTKLVPDNLINDDRLEELESALLDRDHLVQMLTEQLEQAADQLDRLQRMGPERRSSGGSGPPTDLFEGQQALLGQLNRVVGDWEELHASQTLTRIEQQVSEIKELLSGGSSGQTSKTVAELWSSGQETERSREVATPSQMPHQSNPEGWEAIKAAMMASDPLAEKPHTSSSTAPQESISPAESTSTKLGDKFLADTCPLTNLPPDVDLEAASPDELRLAVQSRDDYIARLVRKMASQPQPQNPNWDALNQAPDELRLELESLRNHWQSRIRTAEVDLALQRARLAREQSQLQTQATDVDRQLKRLGLDNDDLASNSHAAKGIKNSPANSRWMSFLKR